MEYVEIDDRLYEFTELAEGHGDDFVVECFDMTKVGGGPVGTIRTQRGGDGELSLERSTIPLDLIRRWLAVVDGAQD